MQDIIIKGRIEFCEPEARKYTRKFTATLTTSAAFDYGNRSAVVIEWGKMENGRTPEKVLIDTRYDRTLHRTPEGFKKWLINYFSEHYQKHILTIN
jgi:hypothetical protein